jgi:hypothetical protein
LLLGIQRLHMAASRPTAAHLAHVAALEEQRQPRQQHKAVKALKDSRLTVPTAAHKAHVEALAAQQGQIRDENDPFWEQRGDKSSSYKGKTFDMSKILSAPRAFTASAIMNQRQRVLCGSEKLAHERKLIEEANQRRKIRNQTKQRQEETQPQREHEENQPAAAATAPAPAPEPAVSQIAAQSRRVSLIPTRQTPSRRTSSVQEPSSSPMPEPEEEGEAPRPLPRAQEQEQKLESNYVVPSHVIEDIEKEIRSFYASPTPRSVPAPFMLASPSPGPATRHQQDQQEQQEQQEQQQGVSCWSPLSPPTQPTSHQTQTEGDDKIITSFGSVFSLPVACATTPVQASHRPAAACASTPQSATLARRGKGTTGTRTPASSSGSARTKRAADDDRFFVTANVRDTR